VKCKNGKCQAELTALEITLWKNKCHTHAAKAYKFVISRLSAENETLTSRIKELENELSDKTIGPN
jgi:hypothetical protein